MVTIEQVEKLRSYAPVGFEEAKQALEETNGNILDAVVWLEKQGRIPAASGHGAYGGKRGQSDNGAQSGAAKQGERFSDTMNRFFRWCGKLVHQGNINYFKISRNGSDIVSIPVTVLVIIVALTSWWLFWIYIPLLLIALFMGCNLSFEGPDLGREDINRVMKQASKTADDIKREVTGDGTERI